MIADNVASTRIKNIVVFIDSIHNIDIETYFKGSINKMKTANQHQLYNDYGKYFFTMQLFLGESIHMALPYIASSDQIIINKI